MRAYASPVSIRKLLSILVALTVLFAPAFTRVGAAYAAAPSQHTQLMDSGHCKMPPSQSRDHGKAARDCCISMCMTVAVAPAALAEESDLRPVPAVFAVAAIHLPYLGEIATPPPRVS